MYKHEQKYCPRCNGPFECKVGSISLCQCSGVTVTESERSYMAGQYEDCLCAACMVAVKSEYKNGLFQKQLDKILRKDSEG